MKKFTLLLFALCVSAFAFGQLKVQSDGTTIVGYESDFGSVYRFGLGKPTSYTIPPGPPNGGQTAYTPGRWFFEIGGGGSFPTNYLQIKVGGSEISASQGLYVRYNNSHSVGIGKVPIDQAKLDVNGSIYVNGSTLISSDERFKSDIRRIDNVIPKIYELEGKSYQKMLPDSTDTFFEYGFIAQELQRQFPDLVVKTSDDYYAVNYIALIPVIVEALKSQKQEIAELNERIFALERRLNPNVNVDAAPQNAPPKAPQQETEGAAALYQNTPNPFTQSTEIRYYLPVKYSTAFLCIYDLQGKELKQIALTGSGTGVQTIHGHELHAGMYLYSLIADNQLIDTKRMILTK